MQRTLAILNQKGGVGKTTVTLGLASAAAAAGQRVLVVDLDPQGSSTWVLGVDPTDQPADQPADRPAGTVADLLEGRAKASEVVVTSDWIGEADGGVDLIASSPALQSLEQGTPKRLRKLLAPIEQRYAAVLIDCPPSLGNLTRSALSAARHAVIVVEPSALGLRGIGGVADLIDDVWDRDNPDVELAGVILNRVPAVSSEAERRIGELARIVGRRAIWQPPVPQRVILNQAIGERAPIHAYGMRAAEPIEAFDALWRKARRLLD